jgi:uncharacterized protein
MKRFLRLKCAIAASVACLLARAASADESGQSIPPEPKEHYTDYTHKVCHLCVENDNARLAKFERATSNRIIVVVYPKMESSAPIADYTARVFKSWEVGRRKNGVALFVFADTGLMYVQVGDGLKKQLPDSVLSTIFEKEMMPSFLRGEFGEGIGEGLTAIMKAIARDAAVE